MKFEIEVGPSAGHDVEQPTTREVQRVIIGALRSAGLQVNTGERARPIESAELQHALSRMPMTLQQVPE